MSVPVSHISTTITIFSESSGSTMRFLIASRCGLVVRWPASLQAFGSFPRSPVMTTLISGQPGRLFSSSYSRTAFARVMQTAIALPFRVAVRSLK